MPYRTLGRRMTSTTHSFRIDVHMEEDVEDRSVLSWILEMLRANKFHACSVSGDLLEEDNPKFSAKLVAELLGLPWNDVIDILDDSSRDPWEGLAEAYFGKFGAISNEHRQLMYMFGALLRGSQ